MSALPQPSTPNADADRIRRKIEHLSQEQTKALDRAMYAGMTPAAQTEYDQHHKEIADLLRQLTALNAGECSKLSAKMVELSLHEAQCDPTVRESVPSEQRIARPSFEHSGRTESMARDAAVTAATPLNGQQPHGASHVSNFAARAKLTVELANYWGRSVAVRRLRDRWKSVRLNRHFLTLEQRILLPFTLVAGRGVMRLRTALLTGYLRKRNSKAAKFLADRISASRAYRCRDCGREVGFRSHPRTSLERYILPLLLTQPVRCAACFRRDYWPIFTTVRGRYHQGDATVDHIHGDHNPT